jgi:hypothetical protein
VTGGSAFAARSGHERFDELPAGRQNQVAQAWESLLQIRRLTQAAEPELPAPWERNRPLQAVGLALEAFGLDFAAVDDAGAVVRSGVTLVEERQGVVRAEWANRRGERPVDGGEARLAEAAEAAGRAGWDALLYRAGRSRYLLIEPGRAT